MPRNKSEALPRCPEAHAYADECEHWLKTGETPKAGFFSLWNALPSQARQGILSKCGQLPQNDERVWRKRVVTYIRTRYVHRPQ